MWSKLKPTSNDVNYNKMPKATAPYELGELTDETLNNALDITNFIRYIAYLPSNVYLDNNFNIESQAAAVVNAANDQLTHNPKKPTSMDERFYEMGSAGAKTSNLAAGHNNLITNIVDGYMNDGGQSNISRVGHRLWILSPRLKKVGFGFASIKGESSYHSYSAMKVIDSNMGKNSYKPFDYVSWPSKVAMPVEYFNSSFNEFPWSVSLNHEKYDNKRTDEIKVELIRESDNKKWEFANRRYERPERNIDRNVDRNANGKYDELGDGYFNVATGNYGYLPFTIIFRPKEVSKYNHGDKYKVVISNIYTLDGRMEEISFETTFFELTK